MSTFEFMQRLFPPGSIKPGMSKEDFAKEFDRRLRALEDGGFLEATALPKIEGEEDLVRKLALHRQRGELMVVKYWKRGCIPCLSKAEMFKEMEQWTKREGRGIAMYSVDIKHPANRTLSDYQLVDGTPSLQKYFDGRQVGGEVMINEKERFQQNFLTTLEQCRRGKCPETIHPEMA